MIIKGRLNKKGETMEKYRNFHLVSYAYAYYLEKVTDEQLRKDLEHFLSYAPLEKMYVENHRGRVTIPKERLLHFKGIFEEYGLKTSGAIVPTGKVGERKPSIVDSFCYTDPEHRKVFLGYIRDLAETFDEIILDDFFFTACRCDKCIAAKGSRSWSEYRRDLMAGLSREMVDMAHEINPGLNFIIKYPAWYKSYHETGYDPEAQRKIFDEVYTGTETRIPDYNMQHFQRYHSYSIMRWMNNAAPGMNGGGWIDSGGSGHSINVFLEQVEQTVFAGTREVMLWNFRDFVQPDNLNLPPVGKDLYRMDRIMDKVGGPTGIVVYEPFNSDGEDMVYNYYGMRGLAFEPKQEFDMGASSILLTSSSAMDKDVMSKLKAYLEKGGTAIITNGFLHDTWDRGIRDLTNLEITGRHMRGSEYMTGDRNHAAEGRVFKAHGDVEIEIFNNKDNAGWEDVSLNDREFNAPFFNEEDYSNGQVFLLNVPMNYADIYNIPGAVMDVMARHMTVGQKVFISSDDKVCLYNYDNGVFGIHNLEFYPSQVRVHVRGDARALVNIETGERYDGFIDYPEPTIFGDAVTSVPEEHDKYVDIRLDAGHYSFFEIV
jgi:hypothetical protein